jgi:hypothetical protein
MIATILLIASLGTLVCGVVRGKPILIVLGLVGMGLAFTVPAEVA